MAKQGGPTAVIVRPETESQEKLARVEALERFRAISERIAERNPDKDPDEELAFITEVVEEVRQERYERAQREASDRR